MKNHKFQVLLDVKRENITVKQAAQMLDTSEKGIKQMMTIWGPKLAKIVPVVSALMLPKNTKSEQTFMKNKLAHIARVTPRQVNRLLTQSNIEVPPPISVISRVKKRATAESRRKKHEKHAIDVIAGLGSAADIAEAAGVSVRHIYRLANKLCKVVGLKYVDMRGLTPAKRARVVSQIEKLIK